MMKVKQHQTNSVERISRVLVGEWRAIWKIVFALVAIVDCLGCWPVFLDGWMQAVSNTKPGVTATTHAGVSLFPDNVNNVDDTCSNIYYDYVLGKLLYVLDWIGPLFCLLCIVEAVIRAQEAREEMLENAALDTFEQKLSRLYSSARNLQQAQAEQEEEMTTSYDEDDVLARRTLRFWTPVLVTLSLWGILLPWRTMLHTSCGKEADSAMATFWITQSFRQMDKSLAYLMDELTSLAWHVALPFSFWQLHRIYQRILTLLRWVRYFRFAGPLLRMMMKLHDSVFAFLKMQKSIWKANAEKAKRIIHRSMLFEDIRRIELQTKMMPGLSRVPTKQVFKLANQQPNTEVGNRIKEKKQQGKKLKRELDSLKRQVRRSSKVYPTSELYDRIMDLSQEFTHTVGSTLWSANLISPKTRFSVAWRIVVTCALISELSRICTSYQLYGRVDVSYTTMMMSVLGCAQDRGGNILTATGRWTRKIVRQLIRLPKEQLLSTCTKSSIASHTVANLLLGFSSVFETTIDLVCFVDIYVWFFTGELDLDGKVIPKPFFYRCILPGTLVQVLDHPTVPDVLPSIMFYALSAANAVGYSRMIRWLVAIVPAVNLFVVDPIKKYYFRPMEHEEWLEYTESLAIFPVFSGADIRYTMSMSHPNFSDLDSAAGDESIGGVRRSSVTMTSASEVSGGVRRSSAQLLHTDDSFLAPLESERSDSFVGGLPLLGDRRDSANLQSSSFLPQPSALSRRISSSMGLNLDSQHVSWGQVSSAISEPAMDDVSMTLNEVMSSQTSHDLRRTNKRQ